MESCRRNSPGKPTTRRYSAEEKAAAVRMVRSLRAEWGPSRDGAAGRRAAGVRGGVGAGVGTQADIDDGSRPGVTHDAEAARVKELEQENRELRRANEILRRAATFFGAELDRQQRR